MMLSPHFSLAELLTTHRPDLQGEPSEEVIANLRRLCGEVLEPIRSVLGVPLQVNSGYRSPAVNAAIGGAGRSQHLLGQAADVVPVGLAAEVAIARIYRMSPIANLGQVIVYRSGFLHISIDLNREPRRQFLRSSAASGSGGPYSRWGL